MGLVHTTSYESDSVDVSSGLDIALSTTAVIGNTLVVVASLVDSSGPFINVVSDDGSNIWPYDFNLFVPVSGSLDAELWLSQLEHDVTSVHLDIRPSSMATLAIKVYILEFAGVFGLDDASTDLNGYLTANNTNASPDIGGTATGTDEQFAIGITGVDGNVTFSSRPSGFSMLTALSGTTSLDCGHKDLTGSGTGWAESISSSELWFALLTVLIVPKTIPYFVDLIPGSGQVELVFRNAPGSVPHYYDISAYIGTSLVRTDHVTWSDPNSPSNNYIFSSLINGTTYRFKISENGGPQSDYSDSVTVETSPQNLTAIGLDSAVYLSWDWDGSPSRGRVYNDTTSEYVDVGTEWSYLVWPGLTNGTNYTFHVTEDDGPPSDPAIVAPVGLAPDDASEEIGFEVEVWSPDTNTMLGLLEGAANVSFQDELNQAGSGSFQINKHDHKIDPTYTFPNGAVGDPTLLNPGNLIRIKLNGNYVFAFFIEEPSNVLDSPTGPSDEVFQPQGRGAMAYLERFTVHPVGWTSGETSSTSAPLDHTYTGKSAAYILNDQIALAKARGAIPAVVLDWDGTTDSEGAAWTDSETVNVHVGNDGLTLLGKLAPFGVDFSMYYGPPMTLRAFKAPRAPDHSGTIVFRQGRHIGGNTRSSEQKHFSGLRTRILVEGESSHAAEYRDTTTEANPAMGIREGYLSWGTTGDIPTLTSVSQAAVSDSENQSEPLHLAIVHDNLPGGYEPYSDYSVGDIIQLDIKPQYDGTHKRIVSITITRPQTGGAPTDYNVELDLGSVYIDPLLRLMARQSLGIPLIGTSPGLSGGSGGGGGGGIGGGTGGGACCGGEVLMAEATSQTASPYYDDVTGSVVIEVPITVDQPNVRIRLIGHLSVLAAGTLTDIPVFQIGLNPGGIDNRGQFCSADGSWRCCSLESPPVEVIPEGDYTAYIHIARFSDEGAWGSGTLSIMYQLLVYLVTSGG